MHSIGNLFYGSFWRIENDDRDEATLVLTNALEADDGADFEDLLDDLCEEHDAHLALRADGATTIYFGQSVSNFSEADNDFDEMAFLRVIDLDRGVLQSDVKEKVKGQLQEVPYALREHLSSPGFYIAWETN